MKVHADREVCVGAGMCALTAPAVFTQDDEDGRVRLLEPEPSPVHAAAASEAAQLCPSRAIAIR